MLSDTAIMVWCYKSSITDICLSSVMKYLSDYDIYLIDAVESPNAPIKGERWSPELKPWIDKCYEPYKDRIKRLEWGLDYSNVGGLECFKRFTEEYPYTYYFKMDDDIILTGDGLIPDLKKALEQPDAIVSTALTPIQRRAIPYIARRLNLELSSELLSPKVVERAKKRPYILKELWDKTFPPEKILPRLRLNPDRYEYPEYGPGVRWLACHYLIKRDDYLPILSGNNKWSDEAEINRAQRGDKKIVVDTHHLAYHFSWHQTKEWAIENIEPLIRKHRFWRTNETN